MRRWAWGLAGLLFAGAVAAAETTGVQVEKLLESSASWDGQAYAGYPAGAPRLTILKITIAPNSALPWHTHPMPNAAYVLSGELTVEKRDTGEKRLLRQGDVLPEMVGGYHRGVTGAQPVVLVVFYAGVADMPLSEQ
ncbi:Cupin domain protein [Pigmentiphaga humi]|uniref:Cupin domain protein n=1 Tax=Pigmentiphaga humi TaxID=2478468 RepID=A0A3P4B168_9BURK|nr:cupin domain-containing protein [Pigmentiphaga humi]VCU69792.1 Cupin domain protein [Pigmentiphaga humi]